MFLLSKVNHIFWRSWKIVRILYVIFIVFVANSSNTPDMGNRPHLLSNLAIVADQASKLGVGRTESITSVYSNFQVNEMSNTYNEKKIWLHFPIILFLVQVIQIYSSPLVVTFVADANANTGYIHSMENQLEPLLNDLKEIVVDRHEPK